jgi:hypothetical protein
MLLGRWMQEHEVLAATIFVAASLALTGLFALLERRFKRQITPPRSKANPTQKKARHSGGPVIS